MIKAIAAAREKGMKVITLTGKDGGKMAGTADIEIRVPHFGYADRIQEIHIKVIHILIQLIEKRWLNNYTRHTSSCSVGCAQKPQSHSYLCSRDFSLTAFLQLELFRYSILFSLIF